MPRIQMLFQYFPNIPYKLWYNLGVKQSKRGFYGTFDMAQASEEELPDHYFSKINQFMDRVIVTSPRDKVFNPCWRPHLKKCGW